MIFFLISSIAISQTEELYQRKLPTNDKNVIEFSLIIDSLQKSKNDLYLQMKSWVTEKYVSANDVIQLDDKEAGLIIVKGVLQYEDWITYRQPHTLKIQLKDNKCRIILTNIYLHYTFNGVKVENNIEKIIIEELYKQNGKPNKGSKLHKEELIKFWDSLSADISNVLKKETSTNDW